MDPNIKARTLYITNKNFKAAIVEEQDMTFPLGMELKSAGIKKSEIRTIWKNGEMFYDFTLTPFLDYAVFKVVLAKDKVRSMERIIKRISAAPLKGVKLRKGWVTRKWLNYADKVELAKQRKRQSLQKRNEKVSEQTKLGEASRRSPSVKDSNPKKRNRNRRKSGGGDSNKSPQRKKLKRKWKKKKNEGN